MIIVRPVRREDLSAIVDLAGTVDAGLTTLPHDPRLLQRLVNRASDGFARDVEQPGGEHYLFVAEDVRTQKLAGTSGIVSRVGGFEPFYAYEVRRDVHESAALHVRKEIEALHLMAEHDGPSEIGTLFLHPDYRRRGLGALLSKARFLFMAEHRHAFASPVIAELRGVSDARGHVPFWDAVGRHFFDVDFQRADYLSVQDKKFIAELMPSHPLYIPLLPPEAQQAIGQVHEQTRPALRILEHEGFVFNGKVDIFDAGPIVSCPLGRIRSVRTSRTGPVRSIGPLENRPPTHVIATASTDRREFLAGLGAVHLDAHGQLRIEEQTDGALPVTAGDVVRYAPLRSPCDD